MNNNENFTVQRSKKEIMSAVYETESIEGRLALLVEVLVDVRDRLTDMADYEYADDIDLGR